jgi:serine/threonine-protein kinase
VWVTAAVVLLLLLGGGTWFLLSDGNRGTGGAAASSTSSAQTSAGPTGIQLDPAAFVGRPADEVQARLEAAGLVVRQQQADGDALASSGQALDAGDVAALDPSGVFAQPATQVVLFVARSAYDPADEGGSDQPTQTSEAPTSSKAPAPTSEAPSPSASVSVTPSSASSSPPASGSPETSDVVSSEPPAADAPAADGAP